MESKNTLGCSYGFKRPQDAVFPPMVFAEITNVCNLNCIHCPYSYISKQKFYKPRHMQLDIYKKIVNEVALYKGAILRLVCDGEPMTHPNFLEIVSYAAQKGISPVCLNTNGTLLDEGNTLEILKYVDLIEVSLDAIHKDTYEHIRRRADFEKTKFNVLRLIELRNRLNSKAKIMVSIIEQPESRGEIEEFVEYWSPRVDRVIKRAYTSIGGLVDKNKPKIDIKQERWPCPLIWSRIFINVDGFIKFCVEDWLDKTTISHINYQGIKAAWGSLEYERLRDCHLSGKFQEIPYCRKCVDWPARRWDYDYFYALEKVLQ